MECVEKAPDLKDYTSLGLTDFYVVPHYKNWEMGKIGRKNNRYVFREFEPKDH